MVIRLLYLTAYGKRRWSIDHSTIGVRLSFSLTPEEARHDEGA